MADPTTAGGGTEGLREALCALMWAQQHPHERLIWAEVVKIASQHPRNMGAMRVGAMRHCADALIAGPLADFLARASAERARVEAENDHLRASLANSGGPCAYCRLPREDWAKCASCFPGCARADDAMLCPNVGAWLEYGERVAALEAALEASAYLADRYRVCWLGKPVRDLDEAQAAYEAARSALKLPEAPDAP